MAQGKNIVKLTKIIECFYAKSLDMPDGLKDNWTLGRTELIARCLAKIYATCGNIINIDFEIKD